MITTGRRMITDLPVMVCDAEIIRGGHTMVISNLSSVSVYLDGENVTPLEGFELRKGETITIPLSPEGCLYAVCANKDTAEICYIASDR